ncbi:MAG: FAD-dependent monooxygenase, partial [Burkholderiales bacterium]
MNEPIKADVVIVGAGLVGASLALGLKDARLSVVLIEAKLPPAVQEDDSWDSRVYAISPGSEKFLRDLGVWEQLDSNRCAPLDAMQVLGDDREAEIDFTSQDANRPSLGHIVENRQLQNGLWRLLQRQAHVRLMCPANFEALRFSADHAALELSGGSTIAASLIVGADGADSWVRQQAGIESTGKPYFHSGVVANFSAEKHHGNIA